MPIQYKTNQNMMSFTGYYLRMTGLNISMKDAEQKRPDRILLAAVILLLILGILMVYSASSFRAEIENNDSTHFLKLHSLRVIIGLLCLYAFFRTDYHRLRWLTPLFFLACMIALFIVLLLPEFNDVHRSIQIWKYRFQPSEFMKLVLVFYLAAVFAKGTEAKVHKRSFFIAHYAILLLVVGIVFIEPDLGTAMVLYAIGVSLFYLGGVHWKRLIFVGAS